jgi:hypothetical protein
MLRIRLTAAATVLSAALGLTALAAGSSTANADPAPASPQPAAASLKPGLDVRYWPYDLHSVNDVERLAKSGGGNKGAPLPGLNYDDSTNPVLTSNLRQEVGAEITGFIKFPQSGKYQIGANSNDGVRIFIGGDKVTEDPGIHAMGPSPTGEINVEGGVWYPLRILYFQRHGTWGLQLLWAPAGRDLGVVPANALARVEP